MSIPLAPNLFSTLPRSADSLKAAPSVLPKLRRVPFGVQQIANLLLRSDRFTFARKASDKGQIPSSGFEPTESAGSNDPGRTSARNTGHSPRIVPRVPKSGSERRDWGQIRRECPEFRTVSGSNLFPHKNYVREWG